MSNHLVERLRSGPKLVSPTRTISEGEFCLFHDLCWFTHESHTSKTYNQASQKQFGERILAGPVVLAILEGLLDAGNFSDWLRELRQDKIRALGMLGWDNTRLKHAVLPGDTLRCEAEVCDVRLTSNPRRAVVKFKDVGYNQNNEVVAEIVRVILFENFD